MSLTIQVPAHLGFLSTVRGAVDLLAHELGCDADCIGDLRLAGDELAATVILDAEPWAPVDIQFVHDDLDVFVRISARRRDPARAAEIDRFSRMILESTTESHDLWADAEEVVGVLQRPLWGPF